jgi:hypothetical protein
MADANFVIDLILRARDETAAAFASAIGHEEALRALRARSAEEEQAQARVHEDTVRRRVASDNALFEAQHALADGMRELDQLNDDAVNKQVALERAAKSYQRTLTDTNASEAERVQSLQRVQKAQSALIGSLKDIQDAEEELDGERAAAAARERNRYALEVKNQAQRAQQREDVARRYGAAARQEAREEEEALKRRIAAQKAADSTLKTIEDERVRNRRENQRKLEALDKADDAARAERRRQEAREEAELQRKRAEGEKEFANLSKAIAKNRSDQQKELIARTKEYSRELDNVARLERTRAEAHAKGADPNALRQLDNDLAIQRQRLRQFAAEIEQIRSKPVIVGFDVDTGKARAELLDFDAAKLAAGRDIHVNVDVDLAAAELKLAAFAAASSHALHPGDEDISKWAQYKDAVRESSNSVATFDNFLRGLTSLAIGVFFNQLIVLAGAAAGALTALAGSAVYAGGALGGAFTAGLAQALPVLGVLGLAVSRITNVWKAAQQQQLLQQQTYAKTAKTAKQTADATDAITNASENVAAAHRRERDAQQGLIDARQKAIRQLQDLILQERSASLAAKGAALDQKDAQEALQKALAAGDTGAIARARLQLSQSRLGVDQAALQRSRTRQDLATRRAAPGGPIEGSPEVTQAKQQIQDAAKAADQADRSLKRAERQASVTGDQSIAAAGKLNFMLSQMSDAERKLYTTFGTFIDRVRVQGGKIAEPIISAVDHMVRRVNGALDNPLIINTAKKLADGVGTQMTKLFDHFTSGKNAQLFAFFANEAMKNLPLVRRLIQGIGDAFLEIAKAASPALRTLLGYFADGAQALGKWASSAKGQKALTDFFNEGVKQFKLWMGLLKSVGRLLLDIFNPKIGGGAKTGGNILRDLTGAINSLDRAARSKEGRQFLQSFFENSRKALALLKPILIAVAEQFARLFTPEGLKNLQAAATLISQVLIPAFGDFLMAMGQLMQLFAAFLSIPGAAYLLKLVVGFAALSTILVKLKTVFTPLTAALKIMFPVLDGLGTSMLATFGAKIRGAIFALGNSVFVLRARLVAMAVAQRIVTAAQWLWNASLLGNPLILVVAAVVAVVAALVILEKRFHIFEKGFAAVKAGARAALNWLKDHWKDIITILGGPMALAIRLIIEHWDDIKSAFSNGVNALVGFMRRLPGRLASFAKDAANAVVDAFKGIGGKIISGIVKGVSNVAGFAKDLANAFIDLLNNLLPDKISVPHAPDINLPDNPIPHLARGGGLPGYGGGDIISAKLEPGEHVWTKDEVRKAGGHGVMYALRAFFGGGTQGGPGGYALGGTVQDVAKAQLSVNINADNDEQAHKWRLMLQEMAASTRRNLQDIEARFRLMRVNLTATMGRLDRDTSERWDTITHNARQAGSDIYNGVRKSFKAMADAVYDGLHYVGTSTNKVLRSFEADPVSFSLEKPSTGSGGNRAATGYLGMPGERGGDSIPIWVGRGEAVLNWAHQKMIEPALRAFYGFGLPELFKSSTAYHAGGPQSIGGYAKGGFTGPFGSGSAFTAVANFARKKFGLSMTAGRTNHDYTTSTGNVSDHSWGGAGDFSNGTLTPQEDAFNAFWKNRLPQAVKQLIWRGRDQFRGFPIEDHFDHVHLALQRNLAFDLPRMAKLISRAMRGLSVSDLLAGVTGDSAQVDHIDPIKVKGKGPLRRIIAKALAKARSGANTFLDSQFAKDVGGNVTGPSDFNQFKGPWVSVMKKIAAAKNWVLGDWKSLIMGESGGDPTARNPSSGAFGIGQFLGSTLQAYAPFGATSRNPADQIRAMAKYISDRYGNPSNAYHTWLGRSPHWYGRGGPVGSFARGGYVGKALRAADGFFTGSTNRRGVYTAPQVGAAVNDLGGITQEFRTVFFGIAEALRQFRRKGKGLSVATDDLTLITKEGGFLDKINDATKSLVDKLALNLKLATFRMSRAGNVVQRLTPTQQGDREINNLRAELQNYHANLDRVNDVTARVTKALRAIMPRIRELQDIDKPTKKQEEELKRLTARREDLVSGRRNLAQRSLALRQQIADALADLYQKQLDAFQKAVETDLATTTSGGLNAAQISIAQRKATALGDAGQLGNLTDANIDILRQQQEIVRQAAQRATNRGYTDLAQQYQQQFEELGGQITEAVATQLQTQIDAVNNAASNALASADRQTGFADILDRIGGNTGLLGSVLGAVPSLTGQNANALRQGALAASGQALTAQRTQLQSLLQTAAGQGNLGQVDALTSQLADLDKTIADNIVAQQELTTQIRQSAIDAITGRASFQGGVFGNLMQLAQAVAANTQGTDTLTPGLLQQQRDVITNALFALEDQLKAFGINIGQVTGDELVNALKGLDFTTIEAQLTPGDAAQFEALINSIIDNGSQLEANTQAIDNLNGNLQPQGFSSSAWQWFRQAIFTGMGDVLPQYTIPSFDTGGPVIRGGLARVHSGEYVTNPAIKGAGMPVQEGDINIEVNEAGGETDPGYLAKRMAFERRATRAAR